MEVAQNATKKSPKEIGVPLESLTWNFNGDMETWKG